MTRIALSITVSLLTFGSLARAHEVETHVSGYGLGPFGMNVGLDLGERATFTLGIEGVYLSSQAEGFAASRVGGAGIPIGLKVYLREREVDRVVPHLRVLGFVGAGSQSYEGERRAIAYYGAFAGLGVTYFVREALGLGTEVGVGYAAYHRGETDDRFASFTWRMTLVFRFGDSYDADPSSEESP